MPRQTIDESQLICQKVAQRLDLPQTGLKLTVVCFTRPAQGCNFFRAENLPCLNLSAIVRRGGIRSSHGGADVAADHSPQRRLPGVVWASAIRCGGRIGGVADRLRGLRLALSMPAAGDCSLGS
jgi:hypothetical protein